MYLNFLGSTPSTNFAWYTDWIMFTPLIVSALGLTAMKYRQTRWDLIGGALGMHFILIVTGIISQEPGSTYAFWIGQGLLLGVIQFIWKPFRELAMNTSVEFGRMYTVLVTFISALFILYPAVWYFGTPGPLNVLNSDQTSLAFEILPFLCKQMYGFLDLYLLQRY